MKKGSIEASEGGQSRRGGSHSGPSTGAGANCGWATGGLSSAGVASPRAGSSIRRSATPSKGRVQVLSGILVRGAADWLGGGGGWGARRVTELDASVVAREE